MDCSPPGSSVHGILQTRLLRWVTIPFFKGSSLPRAQTWVPCTAGRFFYCLSHQGNPTISKVSLNFLALWRTDTEGPRITSLCWCPYQCEDYFSLLVPLPVWGGRLYFIVHSTCSRHYVRHFHIYNFTYFSLLLLSPFYKRANGSEERVTACPRASSCLITELPCSSLGLFPP